MKHHSISRALGKTSLVALVLCGVACQPAAKLRPFDASKPIQKEKGYRQDGELVDSKDMWTKLKADPEAGGHVKRAEVLGFVSIPLAAAGGALIGWPLGEAAAGKADPMWELAAVGGGVFAVGLGLAIWSDASRAKAIRVHNAGVGPAGGQAYFLLPDSPFIVGPHSVGVTW